MVRASGYIQSVRDIEMIPLGVSESAVTPLTIKACGEVVIAGHKCGAVVAEQTEKAKWFGGP